MITKIILFGNKKINTNVQIRIEMSELEIVSEIKYLGVIIDNKLTWKSHITYIKSKIAKTGYPVSFLRLFVNFF